jgi:hypothetical protein
MLSANKRKKKLTIKTHNMTLCVTTRKHHPSLPTTPQKKKAKAIGILFFIFISLLREIAREKVSIEYQKEAYTHGCLLLLLKSFCTLLFGDEILNRFPRDNRTEARERVSRFFVALTLPFLGIVIF